MYKGQRKPGKKKLRAVQAVKRHRPQKASLTALNTLRDQSYPDQSLSHLSVNKATLASATPIKRKTRKVANRYVIVWALRASHPSSSLPLKPYCPPFSQIPTMSSQCTVNFENCIFLCFRFRWDEHVTMMHCDVRKRCIIMHIKVRHIVNFACDFNVFI